MGRFEKSFLPPWKFPYSYNDHYQTISCKMTCRDRTAYIWGRKSSSHPDLGHNPAFWGFASAYVSKCRKITRCRRNMVDSAFESWCSILSDPKKIFFIRTHPEELHALKCISSTDILTNLSQHWGQQMLTKCYPTSQGCSCGFQRLKVWPLGVPKSYRTSSYDLPSLLTRSTLFVICWILWKICGIKHNHKKCWPRQRR